MALSANVTPTQAVINLAAYFNATGPSQQLIANYVSPDSLQAAAAGQVIVEVPPLTEDFAVNLGSLFANFSAPIFVSIADITFPGVGFSWASAVMSIKQTVGPSKFMAWMPDGVTGLSSIYITNSTSNVLILAIGALTQ